MFYEKFKATNRINDIIKLKNNKYTIDTTLINRIILKGEGLLEKNIIESKICTKCNSQKLHSFRELGENAGRNTGLMMLK